jgi:hypothetical protein
MTGIGVNGHREVDLATVIGCFLDSLAFSVVDRARPGRVFGDRRAGLPTGKLIWLVWTVVGQAFVDLVAVWLQQLIGPGLGSS